MAIWTKSEQSPQSRMTEGLQRYVLRLSTAGCTADVGNCQMYRQWECPKRSQPCRAAKAAIFKSLTHQQNPPAAQIGEVRLQRGDLLLTDRQLQLNAIGREILLNDQSSEFRDPQFDQRKFAKRAGTT
jgi:hypothetical protein